jgi:hypothetical protein
MSEPWKPRARNEDAVEPTVSETPEGSEDLAALQRQQAQRSKRVRLSVSQQAEEQKQRRQEELRKKAAAAARRRQATQLLSSRTLRASVAAAAVLVVGVFFGVPALKKALDPPLSLSQLQAERAVLDVEATKFLQVHTSPAVKQSPDDAQFVVRYSARRGARNLTGGRVGRDCFYVLTVDRHASRPGKLVFVRTASKPCSGPSAG